MDPFGIVVSPTAGVLVADFERNDIQEFTPGGVVALGWGVHGASAGQLDTPTDLTIVGENVFVVDQGNSRINVYGPAPTPAISSTWGQVKAHWRR